MAHIKVPSWIVPDSKAGMYDKMMSIFRYMKKRFFSPTAVTLNTVIECFGRAGNIEKMEYYFRLMKIQGVKPNPITYCSLVNGYGKAGLLDKVPGIIRQTENTNVVLDTPFFNCVISAYAKSGDIKIMEEMLQLMKEKKSKPDKITYATMVQAYTAHGMDEAARLLEMEAERFDKRSLVRFFQTFTVFLRATDYPMLIHWLSCPCIRDQFLRLMANNAYNNSSVD
jgi:pentatricopeptide repeat protein